MNEEVILKKILNDAEKESKQIIDNANQEIEKLKMNLTDLENQLNKKSNDEIEKYRAEYSEFCLENLKFNKNKLILDAKNFVMKDFKKNAVETIKNLKKAEMIAFLSKIITQNAENSETLIYNIDSIEDGDLYEMDIIKKLNIKVKKDLSIESGMMLSTEIYDKNLSFKNIVDDLFVKNQTEIYSVLF